ncbi:MAG TPA: hypothetical protein VKE25_00320 [Actinomycetes bacterium]|nr:hypothetical protein [Actinomycetes bacterium]
MSDTGQRAAREVSPWAVGFAVFAATLMIMLGILQAIQGLVALLDDEFYVKVSEYTFKFDLTSWGWIHLILGAVVALAGFALLSGALWARVIGIILAVLSAISNFMWVPYYPVWSIILIGLAVGAIWGLARYSTPEAL